MCDCPCNRFSRDAIIAHFSRQNGRSKPLGPGRVRAYKVADPGVFGNVMANGFVGSCQQSVRFTATKHEKALRVYPSD